MSKLTNKQRTLILLPILFVAIVIFSYYSMSIGYIDISPSRILQSLIGEGTADENLVIFLLRLPKTAVAILVGICLTVSGAVMQGVTRNPLATPSMIGVSSGASLGTLILIYLYDKGFGMIMPEPLAAILGGVIAFMIVYSLALKFDLSPVKLILNGIAINSCIGAISLVLSMKLSADAFTMRSVIMGGSLSYASWDMIFIATVITIPLLIYVIYKALHLNILNLGDEMAIGLGVNLIVERKKLLYSTVILTSVAAYISGGIGFVGMIAPHIAKRIVGSNFKYFMPLAIFIGINLVLLADVVSRILANNNTDIPVGTLISIIGAPYLLYLLFAKDR